MKNKYGITNSGEDDATIVVELEESEASLIDKIFQELNRDKPKYAPRICIYSMDENKIPIASARVYTYCLPSPFAIGGGENRYVSTMVDVIEFFSVGEFKFFSFETPKHTVRVAESSTGAIVADSIEAVERIIKLSGPDFIKNQLKEEMKNSQKAEELSNEEFFSLYRY